MSTRRQFLGRSLAGSSTALVAAASFAARAGASASTSVPSGVEPAAEPLSILVLGGTGFIGPHQIEAALARGHRVTMFNRGSRPGMYGDRVEELVGDRDANVGEGLAALEGERRWDVVIDNSGYVPRHVRDSAELLAERCDRYLFTSTVAVYDFDAAPLVDGVRVADRDAPLLAAPEPDTERVTWATYGPLKAEADRIVREVYGERATVVRPTYIVGPGDTSDRFTYWIERVIRGGDVVCPAAPERSFQCIDARDLCSFVVHLAEQRTSGIFNGVGPASTVTNAMTMHALRAFCAEPIELHWPSADDFEGTEFRTPMFAVEREDQRTDATHAIAAGLGYRSLADTVRDTHAWWWEQGDERRAAARGWPSAAAEAAVLAKLRG